MQGVVVFGSITRMSWGSKLSLTTSTYEPSTDDVCDDREMFLDVLEPVLKGRGGHFTTFLSSITSFHSKER